MAKKSGSQTTIYEVAYYSGLSIATVSRVLNGSKHVAEKTREKVMRVARELNYEPSYVARQLHGIDEFSIGVLLGMDSGTYTPYAMRVYEHLKLTCQALGFRCKRVKFNKKGELQTEARAYVSVGVHKDDPRQKILNKQDHPIIYIGEPVEEGFWVASDDRQGGYLATRHLLDSGYKKPLFICLHADHTVSELRYDGYCKALTEDDLPDPLPREIESLSGLPALDTYRTAQKLITGQVEFDSFVCFSDVVATGVCLAANDCGISIPEDLGVTGYDGINANSYAALTTVIQNIPRIAEVAASLLQDAINGKPPRGAYVDVMLRQGKTTRKTVPPDFGMLGDSDLGIF